MERRLAAIVCADVAGYSRMMGADEEGTHATFKAHRSAIYPIILNHGGRLVKNTGDGFLLEYPSVVGALQSSIEIQTLMAERNSQLPADRLMQFRLGIHMGDVMADEDEVFGDGVNIAVRLESVATPGGVAVSGKAYQEASKHIHVPLVDAGSRRFKNIEDAISVWTWDPCGSETRWPRASRQIESSGSVPNRHRGRASLRQSQRPRGRIFFRRPDRRPHPRVVAADFFPGSQPKRDLLVQGQRSHHAPYRARNRRDLSDPGLGAARRQQDPGDGATDRARERRAIVGQPI